MLLRPKRLFFGFQRYNVKEFFWLVFCIPWARILLLFDERVFLACVLHTLGSCSKLSEVYSKARVRNDFGAI